MADQEWDPDDVVPHLPDILVTMAVCRRLLADALTEVRPFGLNFRALADTTDAIDALAYHLTGQRNFYGLADPGDACFPLRPLPRDMLS